MNQPVPPSQTQEAMRKQATAPDISELWKAVETSLNDADKALPVLLTMLKHAKDQNGRPVDLRAGAMVADEMWGALKYAIKALPLLRSTPPSEPSHAADEKVYTKADAEALCAIAVAAVQQKRLSAELDRAPSEASGGEPVLFANRWDFEANECETLLVARSADKIHNPMPLYTQPQSAQKVQEEVQALLDAIANADCNCTVKERMSGHVVGCWMPEVDAAAERIRSITRHE